MQYKTTKNTLKIKKTKKDVCPICKKQLSAKNRWVKYHVSYKPEIMILACKWCNFTEWVLRNNIKNRNYGVLTPHRVQSVIDYQEKFGVQL